MNYRFICQTERLASLPVHAGNPGNDRGEIIMAEKKKEISFEESLLNLEEIVQTLEKGDLKLDDSLKFFEQGIKLVKECQKKLETAERKVEVLMEKE